MGWGEKFREGWGELIYLILYCYHETTNITEHFFLIKCFKTSVLGNKKGGRGYFGGTKILYD